MMLATAYQATQETGLRNGADTKREVKNVTIHSTRNYSMFRFSSANRPIDSDYLEKLYEAVNTKNLLHRYPILVTAEHIVIDGQHRLRVAEALQVPIYYQIADDMSVGDIVAINDVSKKWTLWDYINYWCEQGNKDYLEMRGFLRRYDWVSPNFIKSILVKSTSRLNSSEQLKRGVLTADKLDVCEWIAETAIQFKPYLAKHYKHRAFLTAVNAMLNTPGYSQDVMMARLEYQSTRLVPCVTADDYLELLQSIYNYRTREDNRIDFSDWRSRRAQRGVDARREQVERK